MFRKAVIAVALAAALVVPPQVAVAAGQAGDAARPAAGSALRQDYEFVGTFSTLDECETEGNRGLNAGEWTDFFCQDQGDDTWGLYVLRPPPRPNPVSDFDGDRRTDLAVFRPSEGQWYIRKSAGGISVIPWGFATDRLVPGDYDGDGRTDQAVFRPSEGQWYVRASSTGVSVTPWGFATDRVEPADYDGDDKTDLAVFRPSEGQWYVHGTSAGVSAIPWGFDSDVTVVNANLPE